MLHPLIVRIYLSYTPLGPVLLVFFAVARSTRRLTKGALYKYPFIRKERIYKNLCAAEPSMWGLFSFAPR